QRPAGGRTTALSDRQHPWLVGSLGLWTAGLPPGGARPLDWLVQPRPPAPSARSRGFVPPADSPGSALRQLGVESAESGFDAPAPRLAPALWLPTAAGRNLCGPGSLHRSLLC